MRQAILALLLSPASLIAQTALPETPRKLPGTIVSTLRAAPAKLPRDEALVIIDQRSLRVQHLAHRLVITSNNQIFREFNPQTGDEEAMLRLLRDLVVVRWGVIGKERIVVEYGLSTDSRGELVVSQFSGFPKSSQAIDLKSLRVVPIHGTWCISDDAGAFLNFGLEKTEAEQALAVCQKYGFNRLGTVGRSPAATYFYTSLDSSNSDVQPRVDASNQRLGVDVPGVGYIGEKLTIDPRKLEVRREANIWTLRMNQEVLARFGSDEWAARDAVRMIQQERYTEFCRIGQTTFFLKNGKPPTSLPFHSKGTRFGIEKLGTRELNGKWSVTDSLGKPVLAASTEEEACDLIRIVKAYGFDTVGYLGGLQFLIRSR